MKCNTALCPGEGESSDGLFCFVLTDTRAKTLLLKCLEVLQLQGTQ